MLGKHGRHTRREKTPLRRTPACEKFVRFLSQEDQQQKSAKNRVANCGKIAVPRKLVARGMLAREGDGGDSKLQRGPTVRECPRRGGSWSGE